MTRCPGGSGGRTSAAAPRLRPPGSGAVGPALAAAPANTAIGGRKVVGHQCMAVAAAAESGRRYAERHTLSTDGNWTQSCPSRASASRNQTEVNSQLPRTRNRP